MKAQKLESIGLLAGGIAHDFNNLLTGILGNISLARLVEPNGEELNERLSQAEKACFQARALTQQLLTFSRGGTPVKSVVNLTETIYEVAHFTLSGSRNRPDIRIDESLRPVDADEGQVRQVLSNIIINADQAMPAGGTIGIRARNYESDTRIHANDGSVIAPGRYVEITITDRGVGIPGEHLNRIFEPYFTTKQKGGGLGLAVSYSIVRRHDGHIRVESEPGSGTSFMIYLPVSRGLEKPREAKAIRMTGKGSGRVLLVDDEATIRQVAMGLLERLGFESESATDSAEAVNLYRAALERGNRFNAVILDLTMPGGPGGKETAALILSIDPGAMLIVSSGYSNDPVMSRYREHGFSEVLVKPYRLEDLARVLAAVMDQRA
jgi:two-component system, cell cycle sensor histidine kinase and response regulator CckA